MPDIQSQPMPEVIRRFNTSQRRELAKIARSNKQIGERTVIVQPGDSIQKAIDALANSGGGIVLLKQGTHTLSGNISGKTQVSIVGEGRDISIIECGGSAYGLDYTGTSGTQLKNFRLADFTLQNSNNTAGIDIDFCDFWRVENVRVTSCDQNGIRIEHCQNFNLNSVRSDSNTLVGFLWSDTTTRRTAYFYLNNCLADGNGSHGYHITQTALNLRIADFSFTNCGADTNTGDGFAFDSTVATRLNGIIMGGYSSSNANGYSVDAETAQLHLIGTLADSNITGYNIDGIQCVLSATRAQSNTVDYDIADSNVIVGNLWFDGASPASAFTTYASNKAIYSIANLDSSLQFVREYHQQNNTSGSTINAGNVVVYNPAASDIEPVTRTTTGGDFKVLGMALETVVTGQSIKILTHGFTSLLTVNGTTDIAIGDYLCAFTTAGIAQKSTTTGQMVFAIALEAYATDDSNGVIDAYILPWRFPLP